MLDPKRLDWFNNINFPHFQCGTSKSRFSCYTNVIHLEVCTHTSSSHMLDWPLTRLIPRNLYSNPNGPRPRLCSVLTPTPRTPSAYTERTRITRSQSPKVRLSASATPYCASRAEGSNAVRHCGRVCGVSLQASTGPRPLSAHHQCSSARTMVRHRHDGISAAHASQHWPSVHCAHGGSAAPGASGSTPPCARRLWRCLPDASRC